MKISRKLCINHDICKLHFFVKKR